MLATEHLLRRCGLITMKIAACLVCCAVALLSGCARSAAESKAHVVAAVPVAVAAVSERAVPYRIRAVGTVESTGSVAILSRVDGPIVRVLVHDGEDVAANEPLIQIDAQPYDIQLRIASANLMRDTAQLEDARAKEKHGRALLEQHYISNDDYLLLKTTLESVQASVEGDRAARDQARLQLGYTTIRAPVAGKLGHVALQVGNMVHANSTEPLTTLNVLDSVDVSFAAPEQQLEEIRHALDAHAATVSIGDVSGDLYFIDNAVDRTSGTIRLRARVDNRSRALWPGQYVTVDLSLAEGTPSTVVPSIAVQQGPDGSYVFVVHRSLVAEQRRVAVTRIADADALITGVKVGEHVVVDGQSRLVPGARVSIRNDT